MPKALKRAKEKAKAKAVKYAAKKLYGADVIEAVAQDCLSAGFMDMLSEWMDVHQTDCDFSKGVGSEAEGMYPPEYIVAYQAFKAFSDSQIERFVAKHKKTVPQFFEMCNKVVDAAPQVQAFIDILSSASEFTVFVDMMTDQERRKYFFFVMASWRLEMERAQQYVKGQKGGSAAPEAPAAAAAPEPEPQPLVLPNKPPKAEAEAAEPDF